MGLETVMNDIEIELDTLVVKGDPTKLYEELAKAQAEFVPVPRAADGQIGMQKFKYASYSTLIRCVRPALAKHGIAVFQPLHWRESKAVSTTILAGHGASIQASFAFDAEFQKKQKDGTVVNDPQEFGRHHTYYRRYQLQAMLGIEGDKDADDLPDVNEGVQFAEERKATAVAYERPEAESGVKEPKKASPKAKVSESVEQKPAPVKEETSVSAQPSEPTTNGKGNGKKPEPKPEAKPQPAADVKSVNELILAGMRQLGWELPQVKEFYKQHVDPAGFEKTGNMTIEQKRTLLGKMVELHQVAPF
jgi:hypothetical protein